MPPKRPSTKKIDPAPTSAEGTPGAAPPPPAERAPAPAPVAPAKEEALLVAPPAEAVPPPAPEAPKAKLTPLQVVLETLAILTFLLLTLIPLARFGLVPLSQIQQINVLLISSLVLVSLAALFPAAGYKARGAGFEQQMARAARADLTLNSLAITALITQILILLVEFVALLVFLRVVRRTAQAVVAAADNFVLFATFTLLLLDMLIIARTSFDSRFRGKKYYGPVGNGLLALSGVFLLLALLKNLDLLNVGFFEGLKPDQSSYILVLGILLQLIGTKMLLRYPAIGRIILGELEAAKRADREFRDILRKKANKAYFLALAYILISIFFIGGVATGQVATGNVRTASFLVILYVVLGTIILGVLFARYIQQRFLAMREKRRQAGEPVAKRRLTREQINKILLYGFSFGLGFLFAVLGLFTFLGEGPVRARYGTDLLILAFLVGVGPVGFYRAVRLRRVRAMDDKFPEFLRDLAEGQRAGMTLPKALLTASKGVYGALTPEIRKMSAQVEWGVNFTEALRRFSTRVKTPLISRTVALVVEASRAGGNTVDILAAAATDAQEIKMILEERRRQMGIYSIIIYVAFLVFLSVIFILANQFLPSFQEAVSGAAGQQVAGFRFGAFETETYVNIFFHAALIQGVGGGLVAGVMTDGHPLGGLKHAVIMTLISWIFFRGFIG